MRTILKIRYIASSDVSNIDRFLKKLVLILKIFVIFRTCTVFITKLSIFISDISLHLWILLMYFSV